MRKENLLHKLKNRNIDIEKMISDHKEFISEYFGSSSTGGGQLNYSEKEMKVLFASHSRHFSL